MRVYSVSFHSFLLFLLLHITPCYPFGDQGIKPIIDNNFDDNFNGNIDGSSNVDSGFGRLRLLPVGRPISMSELDSNLEDNTNNKEENTNPSIYGRPHRGFGNFLDALLGPNHLQDPPHIRFGGNPILDPFRLNMIPSFPLLGRSTNVYPYPEDCEGELKHQCIGLVRVCSGNGCTLECQKNGPAPKVSEKCLSLHPCASDMEKYCQIMADEKKLFNCLIRNKKSLSAKCIASEPCLQENNKDCNLMGVGRHIFGRAADSKSKDAYGEKHEENDACSCKKSFGGFSGCGAHMSHPFCLPCGTNCIRNPICGTGSLWCEVKDNVKCLTDKYVKTFEYSLNKIQGDDKYKLKFPKTLLKQKYRKCKSEKLIGLGSWLKDLLGPVANKVHDSVEKEIEVLKSKKLIKGTTSPTPVSKSVTKIPSVKKTPAQIEEEKKKIVGDVVDPDIVSTNELNEVENGGSNKATTPKKKDDEKQGVVNPTTSIKSEAISSNSNVTHRGRFMTYLWLGVGIALIGTIIVVNQKRKGGGRRRRSSNEKLTREIGDEFL
jgi:hypothetical protein